MAESKKNQLLLYTGVDNLLLNNIVQNNIGCRLGKIATSSQGLYQYPYSQDAFIQPWIKP